MKLNNIGPSTLGLPIFDYEFKTEFKNAQRVLILGGVHGDEIEGVSLARHLIGHLLKLDKTEPLKIHLSVIPELNPDGVLLKTRQNGNGIDLNRNLPTKDWSSEVLNPRYPPGAAPGSEIENKALMRHLEAFSPQFIFSLHSWKPVLNTNEPEGSTLCHRVAQIIGDLLKVDIESSIGYSTPGCLGTYTGLERNIPTLTWEIERGLEVSKILATHLDPLVKALQFLETNPK